MYDKKENELSILETTIRIGLKDPNCPKETKRILKRISGEESKRLNNEGERPDFIRICPPANKHNKPTLIGIEHFRVDQLCYKRKKNGEIASNALISKKEIKQYHSKWKSSVIETGDISDDAIQELGIIISKQLSRLEKTSYRDFISSFNHSWNKHLANHDSYIHNLHKFSTSHFDTEFIYLIEIHSVFQNIFLTDKSGIKFQRSEILPLFLEIIELLEKGCLHRKIDYIIFCLYTNFEASIPKVIAVHAHCIRKSLDRQKIKVYEYAGSDYYTSYFDSEPNSLIPKIHRSNNKIRFGFNGYIIRPTNECLVNFTYLSCRKALALKEASIPYATDLLVENLIECAADHILGWESFSNDKIRPRMLPFNDGEYEQRSKEFEKRWNLGSK